MRKTSLLVGLLLAVGLVGCSKEAKAQSLGVDLSLKLEKNFKDSGPTFFKADAYKPLFGGRNWHAGPLISYSANASNFDFRSTGWGFGEPTWNYGFKLTLKL